MSWPIPKFKLRVDDLAHEGVSIFFGALQPLQVLECAVSSCLEWLYHDYDKAPTSVLEILLVLRAMPGVAYTTGSKSHKEIHLSLDYVQKVSERAKDELTGVITHEMVHCYQYNGHGTCPSGLIEGIADFVRLNCNLAPPHWAKSFPPKKDDSWDSGYEKTAFFLRWIEGRYGDGSVRELNEMLKDEEYSKGMWKRLTGRKLRKLWDLYCKESAEDGEDDLVIVDTNEI